jgi:acyl-CoA synthetase (AMP-forming)/AMP-acid ligase II
MAGRPRLSGGSGNSGKDGYRVKQRGGCGTPAAQTSRVNQREAAVIDGKQVVMGGFRRAANVSPTALFALPYVSIILMPATDAEEGFAMSISSVPAAILLRDRLDYWAEVRPDEKAMTFGAQDFTWRQWRERILRLTGALRDAGVGDGDRVAVLDLNHLATVELTLAASCLCAATVPVNFRLSPDQIRYILEDSRPAIVFLGAQFTEVAAAAGASALVPRQVVVGGDGDEYEPFLAAGQPDEGTSAHPDDVCLVMYTSGTTGRPKGAQLTHRGVNAHSAMCCRALDMGPEVVTLVAMPLFHVGGSGYAQVAIHGGTRTILLREPAPAALFGAIASGATHTFVVPAVIHGILAAGEQATTAFGGLKSITYGAAPMPLPMLRQALDAWPRTDLVQVYGMTEMSGVATVLSAEAHRDAVHPERLASGGQPMPGVDVRVVDPVTLKDAEPGEKGEIWFHSAEAMKGYLNQPRASAEAKTADGWIRSGDIGRVDEAGFVYVLDRVKDMIITGGENVYGPEVESVLSACPGVSEAVIIGVPDDRWGEAVKAIVLAAPGAELSADDVIGFCRARLAHYQCPTSVDFVAELPRNGTGKVLKRALRAPYWADRERAI